jgi:hypothetical protein
VRQDRILPMKYKTLRTLSTTAVITFKAIKQTSTSQRNSLIKQRPEILIEPQTQTFGLTTWRWKQKMPSRYNPRGNRNTDDTK